MLPCQEPLFMPIKKESKQLPSRANSPSGLSKPPASSRVGLRENVRAFKRELIINAAIEVFYRDGYQSATVDDVAASMRSEEHTSELQSLMRISYAVFCLKKKKTN